MSAVLVALQSFGAARAAGWWRRCSARGWLVAALLGGACLAARGSASAESTAGDRPVLL